MHSVTTAQLQWLHVQHNWGPLEMSRNAVVDSSAHYIQSVKINL